MAAAFVFERQRELEALRRFLRERRAALIHGPAGVGKTLLLKTVLPEFPKALYCGESAMLAEGLHGLAGALVKAGSPHMKRAGGGAEQFGRKSVISQKGIVLDVLREGQFCIVLDHVSRPGASFAAYVRELTGWASTPVIAVTRSAHMEDCGSLHKFFPDRSERIAIRNFDRATSERFARQAWERSELTAGNKREFLARVVELSQGNPGAILTMLEMARKPQYRSANQIKMAPLYIDFRLRGS